MYRSRKSLAFALCVAILFSFLPFEMRTGSAEEAPAQPIIIELPKESAEPTPEQSYTPEMENESNAAPAEENRSEASEINESSELGEEPAPTPQGSSFDTALAFSSNGTARGKIRAGLTKVYFSFTTAKGGEYTFSTGGKLVVKAILYGTAMHKIKAFTPGTEAAAGTGNDGFLGTATLKRNTLYYLAVESAVPGKTGSFTIAYARNTVPAVTVAAPTAEPEAETTATEKPVMDILPDPSENMTASDKRGSARVPDGAKICKGITEYPESAHPYLRNTDYSWYYYEPKAIGYRITFTSDTYVENYYDKIYLYDNDGYRLTFYSGSYSYTYFTGSQLSNRTLTIHNEPGFYIRLISDSSFNYYGFKISSIIPIYPAASAAKIYTCEQTWPDQARITWNSVNGASGYTLFRGTSRTGSHTNVKSVTDIYADTAGLEAGKTYWFKVRSYVLNGTTKVYGAYSNAMSVQMLAAPVITTAYLSGGYTAYIKWNPVANATGYGLMRATSPNGSFTVLDITTNNYIYSNILTGNIPYYYKIIPYRMYSTLVIGKTSAASPAVICPAPVMQSVQQNGTTGAKIVWTGISGASGYTLFRSTSANGTYTEVKSGTATTVYVSSLTPGQTYYFKVANYKYVNGVKQYGLYSNMKSVTIMAKPVISQAYATGTGSTCISWNNITDAEGYTLYRANSAGGTYTAIQTLTGTIAYETGLPARTYYYKVAAYRTVGTVRIYSYKSAAAQVIVP